MNNLKHVRSKTGIIQSQLGDFMGGSKQAICNYEKNLSQPPFKRVQAAINELSRLGHHVSLEDVFPPTEAQQFKQAS